jgi:lipoyl-dependent peroxiredoxin
MADIERNGSATWKGDLKSGQGATSTGGGGIKDVNYSFQSRFESGSGTNPEEMIAAAHASCFSMALSKILGDGGHAPEQIRTQAKVSMQKTDTGFKVSKIHLDTEGKVPGLDAEGFKQAAEKAKENCPISVLLKPGLEGLTMDARLVQ